MKKTIYIVTIFLILFSQIEFSFAQEKNYWDILSKVTFTLKRKADNPLDFYKTPQFDKPIKALDKKKITIKGFVLPVSVTKSVLVLSRYPSKACFFCGGAGPESVIEVIPKDPNSELLKLKADKVVIIKGVLKLNDSDFNHMIYMLEKAEIVEVLD